MYYLQESSHLEKKLTGDSMILSFFVRFVSFALFVFNCISLRSLRFCVRLLSFGCGYAISATWPATGRTLPPAPNSGMARTFRLLRLTGAGRTLSNSR
jgi:hypothetical protein